MRHDPNPTSWRGLWLSLLMVAVLGCAASALAEPVTDLKSVAGKWAGHGRSPLGTNPLEWTISEDGRVDVVAATPNGSITGVAKMSLKDGKILYESGTSAGTVTLHEHSGRRLLRYEGLSKRGNNPVGAELAPAR